MMTNVLTLLKKARDLISAPSHWTQKTYARNANGEPCDPLSEGAFSFCSTGALHKFSSPCSMITEKAYECLQDTTKEIAKVDPARFNDTHTHDEVLVMWDKTINRLEQQSV